MMRGLILRILLIAFGTLMANLSLTTVSAQISVDVSWDANTEFEVVGYRVFLGQTSGVYDEVFDVGNSLSINLLNLDSTTTYFVAVAAYDSFLNESPLSEEISFTTPAESGPSSQVTNLEIQNLNGEGSPIVLFSVSGAQVDQLSVEVSSDLTNWQLLGNVTLNSQGLVIINDPEADGESKRFYQIVER